jgi:hypothetical protein
VNGQSLRRIKVEEEKRTCWLFRRQAVAVVFEAKRSHASGENSRVVCHYTRICRVDSQLVTYPARIALTLKEIEMGTKLQVRVCIHDIPLTQVCSENGREMVD